MRYFYLTLLMSSFLAIPLEAQDPFSQSAPQTLPQGNPNQYIPVTPGSAPVQQPIPAQQPQVNTPQGQQGVVSSGPNNAQILTTQDGLFTVLVPPGWTSPQPAQGIVEGLYIAPGMEDMRPSLLVIRDDHRNSPIKEIIQNCVKEIQAQYGQVLTSEPSTLQAHDCQATRFTLSYAVSKPNAVTNQMDVTRVTQVYYVYRGSRSYYIVVATSYPTPNGISLGDFFDQLARTATAR